MKQWFVSLFLIFIGFMGLILAMDQMVGKDQEGWDQQPPNLPISQRESPPVEAFIDVSQSAGIRTIHRGQGGPSGQDGSSGYLGIGQAWADYDNDGWVDLYLTGNLAPNELYRNNQAGAFSLSELSESVSLPDQLSGGAVWADYDNDGWRDLYVLSHGANVLFHNEGGTGFTDVTDLAGVGDPGQGSAAAWGDFNEDGYLDLYVANRSCFSECDSQDIDLSSDRLYRNNGNGVFSDVSHLLASDNLLGVGVSATFVDYDNDGDLDLYVVNAALENGIGNVLWRNDGAGCEEWCWRDVSGLTRAGVIGAGGGLAVGDYDNDLDLDFYFANRGEPMTLLQNQEGRFTEVAEIAGVAVGPSSAAGWGASFFDYNNDGWFDLYLAAAEVIHPDQSGPASDYLFQNNQDGTFSNMTPASWATQPAPSMGMAYADYDRDGHLDYVVGHWNEGYALYRNEGVVGSENKWLTVRLSGDGVSVNRDAIGAQVYLFTSNEQTLMQEIRSSSNLGAGNDVALHFGLGQATVEQMTIVWPDGLVRFFYDVSPNQAMEITYGQGSREVTWRFLGIFGAIVIGLFVMERLIVRRRLAERVEKELPQLLDSDEAE